MLVSSRIIKVYLLPFIRTIILPSTDALRHVAADQKASLLVQVGQCVDHLLALVTGIEDKIAEFSKFCLFAFYSTAKLSAAGIAGEYLYLE